MSGILLHLLPHIASCLLYAALGFHFWHTRWHETSTTAGQLSMQPWERMAILVALILQGIGLYDGLFSAGGMRFSFSYALSLMLWLAVLIYWLESYRSRLDGLQPMVLPLAALCAVLPLLFPQVRVSNTLTPGNSSCIFWQPCWPIVFLRYLRFMPYLWDLLSAGCTRKHSANNLPAFHPS